MNESFVLEFGSKADTLQRISADLSQSVVPPSMSFQVAEWAARRDQLLNEVTDRWPSHLLAVRSSSALEDTDEASMAGMFDSILNVDANDRSMLASAIDKVTSSLRTISDQVLIQTMVRDVVFSGVVMSHDTHNGAPYYVINYDDETGRTDTVTGGTGVNKTVYIARDGGVELVRSDRIRAIVHAIQEIERVCGGIPIDVEFALDNAGHIFLLQVRPISARHHWPPNPVDDFSAQLHQQRSKLVEELGPHKELFGERSILGVMPDWNPAELIGVTPRRLAASLYRRLISQSVWSEARGEMGYRQPASELMVLISGHSYIDVRSSFNSFLPKNLPSPIARKLVDAWIENLRQHPEFHDKVEFEIVQSCIDFSFETDFERKTGGSLSSDEREEFRRSLCHITECALDVSPQGTLKSSLTLLQCLRGLQAKRPLASLTTDCDGSALTRARELLDECVELGTRPFSIAARHAFIAEGLLRSAVERGAFSLERLTAFRQSLDTVSRQFRVKLREVELLGSPDDFLGEYGHLRPATFDIDSLRYIDRWSQLAGLPATNEQTEPESFRPTGDEVEAIDALLEEAGIEEVDALSLFEHAALAISGREFGKFVLSRNISDALELIAEWGASLGLDRSEIANIHVDDIFGEVTTEAPISTADCLHCLANEGIAAHAAACHFKLPALIFEPEDVFVVPVLRCQPNLFGRGTVRGTTMHLSKDADYTPDLVDQIVCIESADPGFDWVLAAGIKGLVTKYGGANSHMAIRCVELGIPAAIGCGDQLFARITDAGSVELNFDGKIVRPGNHV